MQAIEFARSIQQIRQRWILEVFGIECHWESLGVGRVYNKDDQSCDCGVKEARQESKFWLLELFDHFFCIEQSKYSRLEFA